MALTTTALDMMKYINPLFRELASIHGTYIIHIIAYIGFLYIKGPTKTTSQFNGLISNSNRYNFLTSEAELLNVRNLEQ